MPNSSQTRLVQALHYAAEQHRHQRRKDVDASPYINHPIALLHILSVEAPAVKIPDQIEIRVLDLQIGQAIHVRDVTLPPDVKLMDDPDQIVVQVNEAVEMPEEEAPLEAGAQPKLVGRKEEDQESGGE